MKSEQQIAREREQARLAAESQVRGRVLGQFERALDAMLASRPATPAFDTFWRLKGGVSPLALAAGLGAEAWP